MKKFFSFVAVVLFAISASADVIWSESLDKNGSYINKADFGGNWPYATQWYDAGNFVYAYDSVGSYSCSVRNKKLNGDAENSIGLFFASGKTADQCYLYIGGKEGAIVEGAVSCKLMFDICSSEANGGDLTQMAILVNGVALEIPATTLGNKLVTSAIEIPLADGDIQNLHISFNNLPTQKFIANLRIEGEGGQAHGEGGIVPPVVELDTITVARAMEIGNALADGATTEEQYVVRGYAVSIKAYGDKYEGKQTFYMSDDATAERGDFTAYNCAVAAPGVAVGDLVLVTGKIMKYVGASYTTIEISGGTAEVVAGQGIENVVLTEKAQKVVVDGVIYIIRDNKLFNLQGAQVR